MNNEKAMEDSELESLDVLMQLMNCGNGALEKISQKHRI